MNSYLEDDVGPRGRGRRRFHVSQPACPFEMAAAKDMWAAECVNTSVRGCGYWRRSTDALRPETPLSSPEADTP